MKNTVFVAILVCVLIIAGLCSMTKNQVVAGIAIVCGVVILTNAIDIWRNS